MLMAYSMIMISLSVKRGRCPALYKKKLHNNKQMILTRETHNI